MDKTDVSVISIIQAKFTSTEVVKCVSFFNVTVCELFYCPLVVAYNNMFFKQILRFIYMQKLEILVAHL